MSYPRDLDDYTDQELFRELARRAKRRKEGLCDYCTNKLNSKPVCMHPARHQGKS